MVPTNSKIQNSHFEPKVIHESILLLWRIMTGIVIISTRVNNHQAGSFTNHIFRHQLSDLVDKPCVDYKGQCNWYKLSAKLQQLFLVVSLTKWYYHKPQGTLAINKLFHEKTFLPLLPFSVKRIKFIILLS